MGSTTGSGTTRSGGPRSDEDRKVIALPSGGSEHIPAGPLSLVDAYWHALKGSQIVPSRSDVDPRGIEAALSYSFIIERIAPGHGRIRIAGTHMGDLLGMEVRGMPLSALFEPSAREALQASLRCVFDDPAIYRLDLRAENRIGKPELTAQMALYPLCNDQGEISRALGVIEAKGTIGRAPRRFEIQRGHRRRLIEPMDRDLSTSSHTEAAEPAVAPRAETTGFAETQTPFADTGVPYLRVVADNT